MHRRRNNSGRRFLPERLFGAKIVEGAGGTLRGILLAFVAFSASVAPITAESLLPALTSEQAEEARVIVTAFKKDRRGPFYRIRWFCNDGTNHPPSPYPCGDRGGGRQHASLKAEIGELAKWYVDVGTILAGKSFDDLFDPARDHHRLKELVAEHYLEQVDDGWIYRRAYGYRGARQAEDEERAGQAFLKKALSQQTWARRRRFLATQLVEVMPHGAKSGAVSRIRSLSLLIAEDDARFQPLRAKIHSAPDARDLDAVRRFLKTYNPIGEARDRIEELVALLEAEQGGGVLAERLPAFRKTLGDGAAARHADRLAAALRDKDNEAVYAAGASVAREVARGIDESSDGAANLRAMDFLSALRATAFGFSPDPNGKTRRRLLEELGHDFAYAYAEGLFSERQLRVIDAERKALLSQSERDAESYFSDITYLARAIEWARATAAREFGPVANRFARFEPKADGLVDHILRGSPALGMARRMDALYADAGREVGVSHHIFSETSGLALGLNPGTAEGILHFLDAGAESSGVDPNAIYVIPQTVSDLHPMAGVLTLDSGNALSHTQLLAASLGIPNAVISSDLLPQIRQYENKRIFYSVGPRGGVTLRQAAARSEAKIVRKMRLPIENVDLARDSPRRLKDLTVEDAGVIVGPKAANLGRLTRMFPGRVAPGLAIPFGVFVAHASRRLGEDSTRFDVQIRDAFAEARRLESNGASRAELAAFIYPKLAIFRERIRTMDLIPAFEQGLRRRLRETFGESGAYGVFIRSDTNAEDLPEFTGAGLNLSVANQVGEDAILQAIRNVWASPYTDRAYEWRSRAFENPEDVYPSVVVMRTVAADKSGVIATVNLLGGTPGEITVNVSEGISAVVDGGVAESLLLGPDGSVRLLAQARLTYRKVVDPAGGLKVIPPTGAETLLDAGEIEQVREMVREVLEKYPKSFDQTGAALPFDIEFGFEGGDLRLFQIRPLVRRGASDVNHLNKNDHTVRLDEVPS